MKDISEIINSDGIIKAGTPFTIRGNPYRVVGDWPGRCKMLAYVTAEDYDGKNEEVPMVGHITLGPRKCDCEVPSGCIEETKCRKCGGDTWRV